MSAPKSKPLPTIDFHRAAGQGLMMLLSIPVTESRPHPENPDRTDHFYKGELVRYTLKSENIYWIYDAHGMPCQEYSQQFDCSIEHYGKNNAHIGYTALEKDEKSQKDEIRHRSFGEHDDPLHGSSLPGENGLFIAQPSPQTVEPA